MIQFLENDLKRLANPEKAEAFSAYMKNKFPFLGIYQPIRKEHQKRHLGAWKKIPIEQKWEIVFALWELEEREFHYVAMDFLKTFPKKEFVIGDIEKIERLLLSKSWWDSVDFLASYLAGEYFKKFPSEIEAFIAKWTTSKNIWLKRTTLLFQLKYKKETDFERLKTQIEALKNEDEFFIQKAIGWSLREYSKVAPDAVEQFISNNSLSKLAREQGLKYIQK